MRDFHSRPNLAALALLFLLSGFARPVPQQDDAKEKRQRGARTAERLLRIVEEDLRRPDPSDPVARAAELGGDADRIFAFVRDEIATEPYRGVLRGARGTLVARAGNSYDKSLLLRAMIEATGRKCRLVHAALPSEKAADLVRRFLAADPLRGPLGAFRGEARSDEETWKDAAARTGLDAALLRETVERELAAERRVFAEAWEASAVEADHLRSRLKEAGIVPGRSEEEWTRELVARVADHAWVQIESGKKWIDLDPCFGGPAVGEAVPVREPERHRVVFSLRFRYDLDGKTKEEAILEIPLFADEGLFEPAMFSIVPAESDLPPLAKLAEMKPEEIYDRVAKIRKFQATLRVGGRQHASRPFDLDGKIYDVSADGQVEMMKQFGEKMRDMFDLEGGRKKPKTRFLSLSASFRFEGPGVSRPPQKRTILEEKDLERGETPMLSWEILLQSGVISAEFAAYGHLRHMLEMWRPAVEALRKETLGLADAERQTQREARPYPAFLIRFALLRQEAMARLAGDPKLLWDSPNLYVAEKRRRLLAETKEFANRARVDIVDNRVSFVSRDATAALRQGAFDTVVEALLLQSAEPAVTARSPAAAFERARILGTEWTVGKPAAATDPWIRECEEATRVIAAPKGEVAWWSVDPATGTALGRDAGGGGQAMTEYKVLLRVAGLIWCFADLAYDFAKGNQERGVRELRTVLKAFRCVVLFQLSAMGVPFAKRFIGGLIAGVLINLLFGGSGLLGAGWGALSGGF